MTFTEEHIGKTVSLDTFVAAVAGVRELRETVME
jgi:hypothetical protein